MKNESNKWPLLILLIFLACSAVKDFEFLFLKTDQTFIAENILCKLFTIGVTALCLRKLRLSWRGIGFKKAGIARGALLGLSLSALAICLIGNAVNVWAEEGLFRGLFLELGKSDIR